MQLAWTETRDPGCPEVLGITGKVGGAPRTAGGVCVSCCSLFLGAQCWGASLLLEGKQTGRGRGRGRGDEGSWFPLPPCVCLSCVHHLISIYGKRVRLSRVCVSMRSVRPCTYV